MSWGFQGCDGALNTVFLKYRWKFGMGEPMDMKFCRELKHQKIFGTCPGCFQNFDHVLWFFALVGVESLLAFG